MATNYQLSETAVTHLCRKLTKYGDYCCDIPQTAQLPESIRLHLQCIRTSLDRFDGVEVEALIYHAYTMTAAFAWCHRERFPTRYQQAKLGDLRTITFDADIKARWGLELNKSSGAFRVR